MVVSTRPVCVDDRFDRDTVGGRHARTSGAVSPCVVSAQAGRGRDRRHTGTATRPITAACVPGAGSPDETTRSNRADPLPAGEAGTGGKS